MCRLTRWLLLIPAGLAISAQAQDQRAPLRRFRESVSLQTSAIVVKKLGTVGEYLADGQIDEAVEILREISAAHGDSLVPVGPGRYVNASHYGHLLVAGLPPDGLKAYRERVDAQARQWFEQGRSRRDEALLRRVVEQAFASSFGDDALWLLGEWAWDRGELSAARAHWTRILPLPDDAALPPGEPLPVLRFPDTERSQAEILARLVLVSIVEGDLAWAADELAVFRGRHPTAEGELAGRSGRLVEILDAVLAAAREWIPPAGEAQHRTFAVNAQRNGTLPQPGLDVGSVLWADALPPERWTTGNARPAMRHDEPLRLFPVVHGDMVLASDGQQIYHWKLLANEPTPVWPAGARGAVLFPDVPAAARTGFIPSRLIGVARHTLTVHDGRLYARLGSPVSGRAGEQLHQFPSSLVCLDLSPEKQGKRLWELSAEELMPDDPGWLFEGSPAADGGRVYVALRKNHPDAQVRIACLDADSGRPVWNRFVCSSVFEVGEKSSFMSHQLVTLGENAVFYSTDMGAIAALDRRDGRPLWIVTYESRRPADIEPLNNPARNGLTPCLYHRGLVVAAPNDYSGVLAIDAETGLIRWEQRRLGQFDRIRHLLGVGHGKVFVSGDSLWGLDLATGSFRPPGGWGQPPERNPSVSGYGQGLLVGDSILFPRRESIDVRDQATGRMTARFTQATGGNLAVAGKHLIVAHPNRIVVYGDTSGLLNQRRNVVEANPRSIRAHFELAETQELAGELDDALGHFRRAATLPVQRPDDADVHDRARRRMFDLLLRLGTRAAETGDLPQAISRLTTAMDEAPDSAARLEATWRLAGLQADQGQPQHAVRTYQSIVIDAGLAELASPSHDSRTAAQAAREAIDDLIQEHGRSVYEALDAEADRQFAAALATREPRRVRRALEAFPNAGSAASTRLELARLHQQRKETHESIRLCRNLLTRPADDRLHRGALELLARTYEDGRYWRLAARTWRRLANEFPDADVQDDGRAQPATSFVARRLASQPYVHELPPDGAEGPPLPLERLWERTLPDSTDFVFVEGLPPSPCLQCVLFNDTGLHAIDAGDGRDRWSLRLDHPVVWAAFLDAQLVVGTRTMLRGLTPDRGAILWERALAAEPPFSPAATPRFTLLEDRVVCLVPDAGRILAVDGSGELVWEFRPPDAALGDAWLCDDEHTLVQTFGPDRTRILDSEQGRIVAEYPGGRAPWRRDPVRIPGARFAVVEATRRIRAIAADVSDPGWVYAGPASHANADPELVPAQDRLLVVMDGDTLISLDAATGRRQWSRPFAREPLGDGGAALVVERGAIYAVGDGILRRIAPSTGAADWERFVGPPGSGWTADRFDGYVAVWPRANRPTGSERPRVVLCDASTGQYVQDLVFADGPAAPAAGRRFLAGWPICVLMAGNTLCGLGGHREMGE